MATSSEWISHIESGGLDAVLRALYGVKYERLQRERRRYCEALTRFEVYYGPGRNVHLFSAPGRAELGGNNTDHQHGLALAAAVDQDILAVVSPSPGGLVRVKSYGFDKLDVVDLVQQGPQGTESTHSASLIRGIAEEMSRRGSQVGGFDAYTVSDVLRGSGLSSSAAFEVVVAAVFNTLFQGEHLSPLELAKAAQYAENIFFGKPCGLLDPLSCAMGGAICVDFADPSAPVVQKVEINLEKSGYSLCITDTRGSHSEMMGEFARIREEMEAVARCFGKTCLRDVPQSDMMSQLARLRQICGDRAVLRALHFYAENRRVKKEYDCLRAGDIRHFLTLVTESGHSSFEYNQNAYSTVEPARQAIPVALAVSQELLQGRGAWRLQGTGFAGTIQAFVPQNMTADYCAAMDAVFGAQSCRVAAIRKQGVVEITI